MSSSLYNEFNSTPVNSMGNLLNQFNQFRSLFNGNPEAQVRQMLQNGQMSQAQFQKFAQMASQLRPFLK